MSANSRQSIIRAAALSAGLVMVVGACGTPAATVAPTAAAPVVTAEPTPTALALTHEAIPGLAKNSVTFANVEYTLTDGFVSNQDPRNYAAEASPEPTESTRVFLLLSGQNPTAGRPELSAELFNLVLADGKPIAADPLFGDGEAFIAPPSNATEDGFLAFEVQPGTDLDGATLAIGKAPDRIATLVLTGAQPKPDYPVTLSLSGEAPGIGITNSSQLVYTLLGEGLYIDNPLEFPNYDTGARANDDELFLVLDIRMLMESGSVEGTFKDQFRLIVDGAPRAPWNSPDGGSIGPGAAVDTRVGWLIPADAKAVTLQVGDPAKEPGLIEITLP
ncbi:MAG TPA: hypothetical protein VEX41_00780 [Candidatus Eisenbacteria bacterium]|nr:hypothetical protein [Candidatus Eisenbacteria bacterium]